MMNLDHYLEAAKADELVKSLEQQGYEVQREYSHFDLIATKEGERIVFEITSRHALEKESPRILALRERALKEGYTDFRVVTVSPPREKTIEIDRLDEVLYDTIENHYYGAIEGLASQVKMTNVVDTDLESIQITGNGIEVRGTSTLEVELVYGGSSDNVRFDSAFPVSFHLLLSPNMQVQDVYEMDIET